ncbi:hypothetical protein LOK49_Contig10G00024 [Camellia lanceoleosa]|nr:hypothetical protein LOK49_Contig10G00024 [Camellia lanceoleosa]
MLENQIPIFLLGDIFDLLDIDKNVLLSMVTGFCSEVSPFKLIKKDLSLSEVYEHDHLLKLLYHLIVMNVMKVPKEACPINMPIGAPCPEEEIHPKVDSGSQVLCSLLKLSSHLNIRLVRKITKPINMVASLPWTAKSLPEVSRMAINLEEGLKSEFDV